MKLSTCSGAPRLVSLLLTLACCGQGHAAENRYDVLGKVLAPWVSFFSANPKNKPRAMNVSARLERLTGLPPGLADTRVDLALQYPDQLRLHAPILGENAVLCRNGQRLWATPGARLQALLDQAVADKKLAPRDPAYRLEPFQLPLPEKQLVFLPVLFQVAEAAPENVGGEECRVLDLVLAPPLEKAVKAPGWKARLWVRPGYRPARLAVTRPGWEITVRFERIESLTQLPSSLWEPPTGTGADVLSLDPPLFQQLLRTIFP